MKTKITLFFLCTLISLSTFSQTYIRDVTVVDVINRQLIPGQTVVISNDLISAIKPLAKIEVPAVAKVINGTGKFLIPGLTDAHVHFFQSGGLYTRPDAIDLRKFKSYEDELKWAHEHMKDFLSLYLKAGITSVIDVGASTEFLKQRDTFPGKVNSPLI